MPRIYERRFEYAAEDEIRNLHGQLLAEGIHDAEVAEWLGCSPQNVSRHFREASFSFRQVVVIRGRLKEEREKRLKANRTRFDQLSEKVAKDLCSACDEINRSRVS